MPESVRSLARTHIMQAFADRELKSTEHDLLDEI